MLHRSLEEVHGTNPFRVGRSAIFSQSTGFIMPKHSGFKDTLDKQIGRLVAMGFVDGLKGKYYPLGANVATNQATPVDLPAITLEHTLGSIFVWIIGLGIASIRFLVEKLRTKILRKCRIVAFLLK